MPGGQGHDRAETPQMRLLCRDLTYRYPHAEHDLFNRLQLDLDGPGFHALFGPSGVGKTTLARLMAGTLPGSRGKISAIGLTHILYTYNMERLPGWCSVGDHLRRVTPPSRSTDMAPLVDTFGIQDCLRAHFSQLSLGQRNRANLVRYLLQEFDMLIMDESLANVDERTRQVIILKLKQMFPAKCFLYISHNVVEVARFCRQILVLRGPGKEPRLLKTGGLDCRDRHKPEAERLNRTMLEIMNVS
jgi:ABC-type nitrate/sulfonate/bicarbonate transport system ATPase subunit